MHSTLAFCFGNTPDLDIIPLRTHYFTNLMFDFFLLAVSAHNER